MFLYIYITCMFVHVTCQTEHDYAPLFTVDVALLNNVCTITFALDKNKDRCNTVHTCAC